VTLCSAPIAGLKLRDERQLRPAATWMATQESTARKPTRPKSSLSLPPLPQLRYTGLRQLIYAKLNLSYVDI
jgi:hypothetical protein